MKRDDVEILGVLYVDKNGFLKLSGDGFNCRLVIDRPVIRKSDIDLYYPTKHEMMDIVEARFESEIDFVVYEGEIWKALKTDMKKYSKRSKEEYEETKPQKVFVIS